MAKNAFPDSSSLPDGTVQTVLTGQVAQVRASEKIRRIGDKTLKLGGAFEAIGIAPPDSVWLPITGHASDAARRGKKLRVDPDTLEASLSAVEPGRATLLDT